MKNKIKSIVEKVSQPTTLQNGIYEGTWSGYVIVIMHYGRCYELETEKGVRGVGVKVVVKIENGVATFDTIRL